MKYRLADNALVEPLDDGAKAIDLVTSEYDSMNETAPRMWLLLEQGRSEEEIVELVTSESTTSVEVVEVDLASLITELKHKNLIAGT
jgi:hypothetical protein